MVGNAHPDEHTGRPLHHVRVDARLDVDLRPRPPRAAVQHVEQRGRLSPGEGVRHFRERLDRVPVLTRNVPRERRRPLDDLDLLVAHRCKLPPPAVDPGRLQDALAHQVPVDIVEVREQQVQRDGLLLGGRLPSARPGRVLLLGLDRLFERLADRLHRAQAVPTQEQVRVEHRAVEFRAVPRIGVRVGPEHPPDLLEEPHARPDPAPQADPPKPGKVDPLSEQGDVDEAPVPPRPQVPDPLHPLTLPHARVDGCRRPTLLAQPRGVPLSVGDVPSRDDARPLLGDVLPHHVKAHIVDRRGLVLAFDPHVAHGYQHAVAHGILDRVAVNDPGEQRDRFRGHRPEWGRREPEQAHRIDDRDRLAQHLALGGVGLVANQERHPPPLGRQLQGQRRERGVAADEHLPPRLFLAPVEHPHGRIPEPRPQRPGELLDQGLGRCRQHDGPRAELRERRPADLRQKDRLARSHRRRDDRRLTPPHRPHDERQRLGLPRPRLPRRPGPRRRRPVHAPLLAVAATSRSTGQS